MAPCNESRKQQEEVESEHYEYLNGFAVEYSFDSSLVEFRS